MKHKKQKGRGSLVSRVSLCFFSFLLSFLILISPFSAFASDIPVEFLQFQFGSNYAILTDNTYVFTGTTYQSNASKKNISFLDSSHTLVTSPVLLSLNYAIDSSIAIKKGEYINVKTVFWDNPRITSISDVYFIITDDNLDDHAVHISNPSFDRSSGSCTFNFRSPLTFSTNHDFSIGFVLNFRNDFGNTYFKVTSCEIDTSTESSGLLSNLKDFLQNILQSILTAIQNIPNAINQIQTWLSSLGTTLSNAISNIQGWLSNLGSTIGGFFTNIWNSISTTWSTFWSNLSSALTTFKDNVGTWFTNLKDNIHTFFTNLVEDIKGLFVPTDTWQNSNRIRWQNWVNMRFGAIAQIPTYTSNLYNSFSVLYNQDLRDDIDIVFPAVSLPPSVFGQNRVLIPSTHFSFYNNPFLSDTVLGDHLFDVWDMMVGLLASFYLLVFIKRQYYRVFGNFNAGGNSL